VSQWLYAAIAAVVAPAVAYLIAIRKTSGRIQTTEASQLWDEAEKLRIEYRQEIKDLRDLVETLRGRMDELAQDNKHLREENTMLLKRIAVLEADRV
jgi:uncharacterized coiled-coil DUF342 family protein